MAIEKAEDTDFQDDDRADVIVEAADGWRYGSEDDDLSDLEIERQSYDLAKASLERVKRRKPLSPGEQAFLKSVDAQS